MKKSVNGMKFLPHDSRTDSTVAASSAHFSGPLTVISPKTKSISTKAPTYTGPAVKGWSPQYRYHCPTYSAKSGSHFFMASF